MLDTDPRDLPESPVCTQKQNISILSSTVRQDLQTSGIFKQEITAVWEFWTKTSEIVSKSAKMNLDDMMVEPRKLKPRRERAGNNFLSESLVPKVTANMIVHKATTLKMLARSI